MRSHDACVSKHSENKKSRRRRRTKRAVICVELAETQDYVSALPADELHGAGNGRVQSASSAGPCLRVITIVKQKVSGSSELRLLCHG